ncbi:MAG: TerB family tellurite resistance protein [Spirochaetales bacterium]|nr:TerB family tellurite resistance protein [Spirochaetales bacterium]
MAKIEELSAHEKMFLAGCIESVMLADGASSEEEIGRLNTIVSDDFPDFDERLAEFDSRVKDEESFWQTAKSITDRNSQDLILQVLDGLALQDGMIENSETKLLDKLKTLWA